MKLVNEHMILVFLSKIYSMLNTSEVTDVLVAKIGCNDCDEPISATTKRQTVDLSIVTLSRATSSFFINWRVSYWLIELSKCFAAVYFS